MHESELRRRVIRLAYARPSLRKHLLPMLRKAERLGDIEIIHQGRRVYLKGNTYQFKNILKSYWAKWDPDEKAWWISTAKWRAYEDQIRELFDPSLEEGPEEIQLTPAVKAVFEGSKVYLRGNTYPIKDTLKRYNFRWDGRSKSWYLDRRLWKRVRREIAHALSTMPARKPSHPGGASQKQISYALALIRRIGSDWRDTDWGQGGPPPRKSDLEKWPRADVSALIDSLRREL